MSDPQDSAFRNVYADAQRAAAYAKLEFPGTYYLAYRDLPALIGKHVRGRRALDFGCGTGRSTRVLKQLGFDVVGVDIAAQMLALAREQDPEGRYELVPDGDLEALGAAKFNLVLSVFTFDNIPTAEKKAALMAALGSRLAPEGCLVSVVSTPEIYLHEWASFSTKDYPENCAARSGDTVRIVMLDVEDARPVEDVVWSDEAYRETFRKASLVCLERHAPLGTDAEPYRWVNETAIAPWAIYVLARGPS